MVLNTRTDSGELRMRLEEILERIQNVLYQGVDTESQDLDLLRHDIENHIIKKENNESTT